MSAQPIRVAVIGTSFASAVQIPGFQACPGVQVVAVASAREERARQTAEKFGIGRAYGDWRRMLDEVDCDLVSVVTPPYLHHEMTLAALERGRHVLCEKPFASDVGRAREMVERAERAGVVHAVDHEFRYRPARRLFKELVDAGHLGDAWVIRWGWLAGRLAEPRARAWDWWSQRERNGGWFGAIGSHLIDSLLWWFGDVEEVGAQLNTFVKRRPLPDGSAWRVVTADDDVALLLRFASGARCTVDLSSVTRPGGNRLEAYGSAGALVLDEDARVLAAREAGPLEEQAIPERLVRRVEGDDRLAPFVELADRVLARVRGEDHGDFADFHQGLRVQAVMDAAHRGVVERRFVAVDEVYRTG
jgi:predicted dehydrogenase